MYHIIENLAKLFTEFTWKKLLVFICTILIILVGLAFYESTTKSFKLKRIEHITEILTKLNQLETKDTIKNSELKKTYENLNKELLEASTIEKMNLKVPEIFKRILLPEAIYKFLTSAMFWWLLACFPFKEFWKGAYDAHYVFIVLIIIGFCTGSIGIFIPTFSSLWYNYLLFPFVSFVVLAAIFILIMVYSDKLEKAKKKKT